MTLSREYSALLGAQIRARRIAAGITQRALVAATGIPRSSICNWERGRRAMPQEAAQRLLSAIQEMKR